MLEFLPEDIARGLHAAQRRPQRGRLAVHVNDAVFPVLRLSDQGFSVDDTRVPALRGHVDLYDGPRHLLRCLIVASDHDGGVTTYDFKRATAAATEAARDYADDTPRPAGLLTANR